MKILFYSKNDCIWCDKARALLNEKGLLFREVKLGVDYTKEDLQAKLPHIARLTLPQIWINDSHVGGFDALQDFLQET